MTNTSDRHVTKRLPSMPRITVSDAQLAQWVAAATENIEVLQGARGGGAAAVTDNGALLKDLTKMRQELGFQQKSLERLSRTVANIGNRASAQETASPAQRVLAQLRQNAPQKPQTVIVGGSGGVTMEQVNAAIDAEVNPVSNQISSINSQLGTINSQVNALQNQMNSIANQLAGINSNLTYLNEQVVQLWLDRKEIYDHIDYLYDEIDYMWQYLP